MVRSILKSLSAAVGWMVLLSFASHKEWIRDGSGCTLSGSMEMVLFFYLISGLTRLIHGRPKMIDSPPSPEVCNQVGMVIPPMLRSSQV